MTLTRTLSARAARARAIGGFWSAAARRSQRGLGWVCALVMMYAADASAQVVEINAAGFKNVQNLQQLAQAMINFESASNTLPPQYVQSAGAPGLSWRVLVLPFLGQQALFNAFDLSKPWNDPANLPLLAQMPDVYRSPADSAASTGTRYVVGTGANLIFTGPTGTKSTFITDGTSNTLLIGEGANAVAWTKPEDIAVGPNPTLAGLGFSSITPEYVPFAFADGGVRFLRSDINSQVLSDLFVRNDNHVIDPAVQHGFVVVPEPAGLGFGGLVLAARSRRRTARQRGVSGR